ncbi:AAA family ATPase [Vibrio aestuarianus subsp. cardii]|uniref:retron Ec78 anti-phage system effector ATPase PtuA n=1 Tax=Vibrio aestuarianus TaxID=28171 RepID=UPI0015948F15|nr:retron Ec78 anti-phage system effector ATPase PtuA [Vibrio aestuarianus]MDE1309341.1 AAA family ATPase [Vibrio aestuarianus]NGZ91778.1 AAA family ATPase [Vibrio aestuarianus subsp. cardii]
MGRIRSIRAQIDNAEKGVLLSQFQLYENYFKGKHVEKDEELAQKYHQLLESTLSDKKLRLDSLSLFNFRRFRDLTIKFDEKLTVIIGDNGAGKTSFADAVANVFSWFNNNLEKENVSGNYIKQTDVNVKATDFSEITCKFQLDKNNRFETSLALPVPGYTGDKSNDVNVIKQFGAIYRSSAKNESITFPLLAYYSVERSDFELKTSVTEKASGDGKDNRYSALKDALKGTGKLDDFSQLYIELVNLAEGEESKEIKELKGEINTLQRTIDDVYQGKTLQENDPFTAMLNSKKELLADLVKSVASAKYQKHLSFVNEAIEKLVPDVKNLEVDRSSGKPRIFVENFGNKVNIAQLSQGQKMLVALTGDLARRLVKLNPNSDKPLHAHGIVVIDEIELHLHPKWQQEIIIGLQTTFPNLQFIVTTHSPQVLSTVDHKCIRQISLDKNGQPIIDTPTFQTKGVTSASILARIMGTNAVPEKLEEAIWLTDFSRYLKENNEERRELVFEKIKMHFGDNHPVVVECESQIRIHDMKARLAKKEK